MEAIKFARDSKIDVVLVDTAGRMQDNEPLMKALSKVCERNHVASYFIFMILYNWNRISPFPQQLIKVNEPDMVLFVGEALVGNEAVDQLVKFNQAIADNSSSSNPHLIDGIVLTKFDTIDDKVG